MAILARLASIFSNAQAWEWPLVWLDLLIAQEVVQIDWIHALDFLGELRIEVPIIRFDALLCLSSIRLGKQAKLRHPQGTPFVRI
jgi:hypothetical protein